MGSQQSSRRANSSIRRSESTQKTSVVSPSERVSSAAASTRASSAIDRALKQERVEFERQARTESRVLILGTGDSGKSTVLKQIRLIYGCGFTDSEIATFRSTLLLNVVTCAKCLVHAMKVLQIPYAQKPSATSPLPPVQTVRESVLKVPTKDPIFSSTALTIDLGIDEAEPSRLSASSAKGEQSCEHPQQANGDNEENIPDAAKNIRKMSNIYGFGKDEFISAEILADIETLWNDEGVQVR
ncbi:Guanine nucleotide-binding protein subunit alpha-15 [Entophlyctis luteolus]|nr:Guanine nucleotide-binding protein subunit alpha-15 [Entophlyctis luteolus]